MVVLLSGSLKELSMCRYSGGAASLGGVHAVRLLHGTDSITLKQDIRQRLRPRVGEGGGES